jgi:predicted DNA-binding protein with PD1-like motif
MTVHALRLRPGQDLKKEIDAFSRSLDIQAGFILTCVGSLRRAVIRPAGQPGPLVREQKFEIVSLVGTLSPDGPHLHIGLADETGAMLGGHLLDGNVIYTTAEMVIGEAPGRVFRREVDPETTFRELLIDRKARKDR